MRCCGSCMHSVMGNSDIHRLGVFIGRLRRIPLRARRQGFHITVSAFFLAAGCPVIGPGPPHARARGGSGR
jgi:hypothetical protein